MKIFSQSLIYMWGYIMQIYYQGHRSNIKVTQPNCFLFCLCLFLSIYNHQDSPRTQDWGFPYDVIGISPMTHQDSPMTNWDSPMTSSDPLKEISDRVSQALFTVLHQQSKYPLTCGKLQLAVVKIASEWHHSIFATYALFFS